MFDIGVLRDFKSTEGRVFLTPEGAKSLVDDGQHLYVEENAGRACGFSNKDYEKAGAVILPTMEKIYQRAQLLIHVQPPQPVEYELFTNEHYSLSFLNLINNADRLNSLRETGATFISAELIQDENAQYPILRVVSEIAGRMAIFQAALLLTTTAEGKGKYLSGLDNIEPATVTIIGAGMAGRSAAATAAVNGARVNLVRLKSRQLDELTSLYPNLRVYEFSKKILEDLLPATDVLIIAVFSLKCRYDVAISKEMIQLMGRGSVVIDLSAEQSHFAETSHLTSHEQPTYILDGLVYYCVPNISAVVPVTASKVLGAQLLPYIRTLARHGLKKALLTEPGLVPAISLYKGKITNRYFADYYRDEFYNIFELLELNL